MSGGTGLPDVRAKVGRRQVAKGLIRPIVAAAILLTGYFLLPIEQASDANWIGLAIGAVLLVWFCVWEVRHFIHSAYPVATAIEMLVALAVLYIVVFSTVYYLFSEYGIGSFTEHLTRIDSLYFCLTVFTTTGFGDITAESQSARVAVSVQMASTFVLLGLGLRFVNLMVSTRVKGTDSAPPADTGR